MMENTVKVNVETEGFDEAIEKLTVESETFVWVKPARKNGRLFILGRTDTEEPETHEERTETHACDCEHTETHACDLISRKAAIDAFEDFIGECDDADPFNLKSVTMTGIRQILKALPSAEQGPQWIPVNESLPAERGYYLVTDTDGDVEVAWFRYDFDNEESQWWLDGYGFINVVAWISFPSPYKAGKQDE